MASRNGKTSRRSGQQPARLLATEDALLIVESEIQGHLSETVVPLPAPVADYFEEGAYLKAFPDILSAVAAGRWRSARDHFLQYGLAEGRLDDERYHRARTTGDSAVFPGGSVDAAFVSPAGYALIIGWIDDQATPLIAVELSQGGQFAGGTNMMARRRREDAEAIVSAAPGTMFGFWAMFRTSKAAAAVTDVKVTLCVEGGRRSYPVAVQVKSDEQLRDLTLEYFASSPYFGNPQVEALIQLEGGAGAAVVELNVAISSRILSGRHHMRFGPDRAHYDGSIVVCLYGKPEFVFLQAAMFSTAPGWERYEFIYVSNSPELAETLVKEATLAARIYGVSITLLILPGNAGFGAANNAGVNLARSGRILIVNPDVFPRRDDWAARHAELVNQLPAEQTAIFGVPLYYDDGSLMHGGMFFESDVGLSMHDGGVQARQMIRVEHYGKGAPPGELAFLVSRRIPATTGAFISMQRAHFESLGGFAPEYVFGHYEDADLCLKSYAAGRPVWLHDLPFWHFEGKGSSRRPVHDGGSSINRWHFTRSWGELIHAELLGKTPKGLAAS